MVTFLKWVAVLLVGGVVALFLWWLFFYIGWMPNYSDGQRTGDIYKFSKKGIWYKSWEGEMYLGGVHSTGGKNPTMELDKFYFSIPELEEKDKSELIAKIQKCSEERRSCTIEYKQWLKGPIYIDRDYTVTGVKSN